MAKQTIISCDICGTTGADTCYFYTDRRMDPAGSMEDIHESIDLCGEHKWTAYMLAEKWRKTTELGSAVYQQMMALVRSAETARRSKQEKR